MRGRVGGGQGKVGVGVKRKDLCEYVQSPCMKAKAEKNEKGKSIRQAASQTPGFFCCRRRFGCCFYHSFQRFADILSCLPCARGCVGGSEIGLFRCPILLVLFLFPSSRSHASPLGLSRSCLHSSSTLAFSSRASHEVQSSG